MESDTLHAGIEHRIAELRGAYPQITSCDFALQNWREGDRTRHALWLDIRWPQHQSVICGPACDSVHEALRSGFDKARQGLEASHA